MGKGPSQKTIDKWTNEALKYSKNPQYIEDYIEYKQLAGAMDSRLRALEALSHESHYRSVKKYAYARAMRDIESWGGNKRFNTAPPYYINDKGEKVYSIQQLRAKIQDIKRFEGMATSTKTRIDETYSKRADTINERYGGELTWQEIANYYSNESNKQRDSKYGGSKTVVRALAVIKKLNSTQLPEDIQEANEKILMLSGGRGEVARAVKAMLGDGLNYANLLGGN